MSLVERIAEVQRAHRYSQHYCVCWCQVDPDRGAANARMMTTDDHPLHVAGEVAKLFTREWTVSSGGEHGQTATSSREEAERALYVCESNNEHWQQKGRGVPRWAKNPFIESRYVSAWERDQ